MTVLAKITVFAALLLSLQACGHKPLKAPCSLDEAGAPLGYAATPNVAPPAAFTPLKDCGALKPV